MRPLKGITILGAGNIAWHLALGFSQAGVKINSIISRSIERAKILANEVNAPYSSDFSDIPIETDFVFLCLTDSVVAEVAQIIGCEEFRLVHTSGSLPLSVLGANTKNTGVFYPFQTFSKQVNPGKLKYPVCLESEDADLLELLKNYANAVSDRIVFMDSDKRKKLHLGGVLLNNFSNHLMARTFDFAEENNIDTELFLPILEETVHKIKLNHPREVQTGPAIRGNKEILKKHLDLLKSQTSLYNIYQVMSNSIEAYYSKEDK